MKESKIFEGNKLFFTLFAIMSLQWGVSVPYFSRRAFVQRAQECCASPLVHIISSRLICNLLTKQPREGTESDTLPYDWWNLGQFSRGDFPLTGSCSGKCFTCPGCWTDTGHCRWIIHRLWRATVNACVLYSWTWERLATPGNVNAFYRACCETWDVQ